jgi:hypothetical protein
MQVATTAPQTPRELLAVGPDMAKVLTVVALRKSSQSSAYLYLDDNESRIVVVCPAYLPCDIADSLLSKEVVGVITVCREKRFGLALRYDANSHQSCGKVQTSIPGVGLGWSTWVLWNYSGNPLRRPKRGTKVLSAFYARV